MNHFLSRCIAALRPVLLAGLCAAASVHAGQMPNGSRAISITAREQPIAAFLQDLFAAADVPVVAAPSVQSANPGAVDFRVFYLRYAWAQDQTMTVGGRQVVLPGVASILRSLVGARAGTSLGHEVQLRPTQPSLRGQGLASQGVQKT